MNKEFEKAMQARFQDYEAQVGDHLFDAIQAGRRKRRAIVWWWRSLSGAAILILSVLFLYQPNTVNTGSTTGVEAIQSENILPEQTEPQSTIPQSEREPLAQNASPIMEVETPALHASQTHVEGSVDQEVKGSTTDQIVNVVEEAVVDAVDAVQDVVDGLAENNASQHAIADVAAEPESDEIIPIEEEEMLPQVPTNENNREEEKRKHTHRRPSVWGLDAYVGPGYASRIYSGEEAAKQWRTGSEAPSMSFNAGISLSYKLNPRTRLATGLQYAQRNEILNFDNGNTVHVSGRNHYSRIAVPLSLEYDLYVQNQWKFRAFAGLSYSLDQQQKGKARVGEQEILILQDQEIDRMGITSALLGLGIDLRLNRRTELMIQPLFMHDLNATNTGTLGLERKEFAVYADIGLRFAL